MNGSGSAPITMAPGWLHGVQQTTLERGVLRGITVTPPTYPGVSYAGCCLFRCLASAGEERGTQSPNMEATSPTESDVSRKTHGLLHRFLSGASAKRTYL